ncbi:membrane-bound serine protease (ClpP class) [Chryseomicrobium aureum]|uniref:NfeD family protein n=1 Tax=Chryseomicrobium aureum TaxID=1441723 RepID=UPI00195708AD|nr:membrane-bound serine protease (ClpP class) [Chryseomicrobium aureum]
MKKLRIVWVLSLLLGLLLPLFSVGAQNETVYRIPLDDVVEKALYTFLAQSIEEAEEANAEAIIIEMNTPGGLVDEAENIAKLMADTEDIPIYLFINNRALSAGAFLALYAEEIYMSPNATMGAAAVIDQTGNAADEKARSAWAASMRNAAEYSGRNPVYALAMVDESLEIPELGVDAGELLTLSASEALEVGYAEGIVNSLDEVLDAVGLADAEVVSVEESFLVKLARFVTNPIIVPILLSIGSLGLVLELYSPGFGLPGIAGLSALMLFFYGHMIAGLAGYEAMLLFALGVILLIAEIFLPFGISGVLGGIAIIGSLYLAGADMTQISISILIALGVAIIGMVIIMKFFGRRLKLFNKIILSDSTSTERGYVSSIERRELVGSTADTLTPLRPSGTIVIGDERLDAVSEGNFIDRNKKVIIRKVEGSRIVVRELKEEEM